MEHLGICIGEITYHQWLEVSVFFGVNTQIINGVFHSFYQAFFGVAIHKWKTQKIVPANVLFNSGNTKPPVLSGNQLRGSKIQQFDDLPNYRPPFSAVFFPWFFPMIFPWFFLGFPSHCFPDLVSWLLPHQSSPVPVCAGKGGPLTIFNFLTNTCSILFLNRTSLSATNKTIYIYIYIVCVYIVHNPLDKCKCKS